MDVKDNFKPNSISCPKCEKVVEPRFWGGNDWRFGCACGFVDVKEFNQCMNSSTIKDSTEIRQIIDIGVVNG